MNAEMRQTLAKLPFDEKLRRVAQLVELGRQVRRKGEITSDYVKERDALFAGETVNSLFEQAAAYQPK